MLAHENVGKRKLHMINGEGEFVGNTLYNETHSLKDYWLCNNRHTETQTSYVTGFYSACVISSFSHAVVSFLMTTWELYIGAAKLHRTVFDLCQAALVLDVYICIHKQTP